MLVLTNLTKLLESIKASEKKYDENKFLPYNNYYYWHLIVQNFLQTQLIIELSQTHCNLSCNTTQLFRTSIFTAWNII